MLQVKKWPGHGLDTTMMLFTDSKTIISSRLDATRQKTDSGKCRFMESKTGGEQGHQFLLEDMQKVWQVVVTPMLMGNILILSKFHPRVYIKKLILWFSEKTCSSAPFALPSWKAFVKDYILELFKKQYRYFFHSFTDTFFTFYWHFNFYFLKKTSISDLESPNKVNFQKWC